MFLRMSHQLTGFKFILGMWRRYSRQPRIRCSLGVSMSGAALLDCLYGGKEAAVGESPVWRAHSRGMRWHSWISVNAVCILFADWSTFEETGSFS